ncbi:hypothetical protein LGN43_10550 [Burkholderia multivorans]|nr:hypothetical protein [Burkholderia multivorans]
MHKLTAAMLAGFAAFKEFGASIAARIHAFLLAQHVANLRKLIERANKRVRQFDDVVRYHKAAAIEAEVQADEAARAAEAVERAVKIEATLHGVTV